MKTTIQEACRLSGTDYDTIKQFLKDDILKKNDIDDLNLLKIRCLYMASGLGIRSVEKLRQIAHCCDESIETSSKIKLETICGSAVAIFDLDVMREHIKDFSRVK